jgi:hypothetical protein
MNKTIKKIVALGFTGVMAATTLAVAVNAATLADYPSPFVVNGAFVGKIVIGEKAAAVDTLGSMDIAASLQRESSTSIGSTTGETTAVATDGGYLFSGSQELVLGDTLANVTTVVDDVDLPVLLKSGTIESDSGSNYDYDVEIDLPASSTSVSADVNNNNLDDIYTDPIVYYNLGTGTDLSFYQTAIDFTDTWSASDFVNSETIELFGRAYTFDQNNADTDPTLIMYGSDTTLLVGKGETKTITYNGQDYTVEVLGGNSDSGGSAILSVGSDTRTITQGQSKTIGGLPIYVKDVFISNIGGDDVSVQLFLGSNKLELDAATGEVKLNGNILYEVQLAVDSATDATWVDVNSLTFTVTPNDADNEVQYILPGEDYVDPVFGSFKFHFVGAEDLMAGKEPFTLEQSGKKLNVVFTPRGAASATTWTVLEDNLAYENLFVGADLTNLQKDDMFIYNEYPTESDKAVTHLLKVTRVKDGNNISSTNYDIIVEDLSFDKTYEVTKCKALDSKIALFPVEGSTEYDVTFSAASNCTGAAYTTATTLYTDSGAEATFMYDNNVDANVNTTLPDTAAPTTNLVDVTQGWLKVNEDVEGDADSSTSGNMVLKYNWDTGDDAYSVSVYTPTTDAVFGSNIGNDDNKDFYLSQFGTYVVADADTTPFKYVKMYIPATEVTYDMFLLPIDSTVTVTSTSGGSAVVLYPIAVGMAILDSDATLESKPYIVVGGPCANTVAAELMGNPADCTAGFTEGKAMIKLYSDKNALLVAGYSGKDTQGASRVLANYMDYAFSGTELEVITTNLAKLSVNKVN